MLNECRLIAISWTVGSVFVDAIDLAIFLPPEYDWRASCFDTASTVNDVMPFVVDGFSTENIHIHKTPIYYYVVVSKKYP